MRHALLLALLSVLAGHASTQGPVTPYGTASPGTGGHLPRIWVEGEPRLGNTDFRYVVDRATAGAPAFLLFSTGAARLPVHGLELLIDPFAPLTAAAGPVILGGEVGAGGVGTGEVPFPIPDVPYLEGWSVYAQWIVVDGAAAEGLAASDAAQVTVRRDALLVATDYETLETATPSGVVTPTSISRSVIPLVMDIELTRDGTLACLATFHFLLGSGDLEFWDLTVDPPALLLTVPLRRFGNLVTHPTTDEMYVLDEDGVSGFDTDRDSPTFGQIVSFLSFNPGSAPFGVTGASGGAISADGRVFALTESALFVTPDVLLYDAEPGSPTRGQELRRITNLNGWLALSPDAATLYVLGGNLQYVDTATGVVRRTVPSPFGSYPFRLEPNGRSLAVGINSQPGIAIANLETGTWRSFTTSGEVERVAWSADGAVVIAAMADRYEAYDARTGGLLWTVQSSITIRDFSWR